MITRVFRGKLIVIGDPAVGKTALCQLYIKDGREFTKNYSMTFAAEVNSKLIPIPGTNDAVEFLIIDSPGIDLYTEILPKFWNRPDLLLIVFDVTKIKTLDAVADWISVIQKGKWRGDHGNPIAAVLFGNKTDLENRKACTEEEAIQVADRFEMKYFSGSVVGDIPADFPKGKSAVEKNNQGLEDPMQFLAEAFYKYCLKNKID